MLIVLFLGFSSGLPLALSGSTLLVWMRESGVDLGTIGLFALVGTPYTIKFLWAPVVDALDVPVLSRLLGRRRGWLVLLATAADRGDRVSRVHQSGRSAAGLVALGALLVAAASATQDIVIDAFRVESLDESEQAAGMASYVAAYRIGMLASTAGALYVVTGFESGLGYDRQTAWTLGYLAMALLVVIGMVTTLLATEPETTAKAARSTTRRAAASPRVWQAAVGAFSEFLTRDAAIVVLAFVILYKFCDAFAGAMTAPFVIDLGFSRTDYAAIVKGVGLAATLIGGFAGGVVARALPLTTCLWIGAHPADRSSNLVFAWLAHDRHQLPGADGSDHRREFHRRDRHGDLRRLPVRAVQEPAAHSDAIRAADRARRGRAHVSVRRRRLRRRSDRLAMFYILSVVVAIPSLILLAWLQGRGHFRSLETKPA